MTEIVAIRNGLWRQASFETLQEIDAASEHFGRHIEGDVFRRALGVGAIPVNDWLDKSPFRGVVRELRKEWGISRVAQ